LIGQIPIIAVRDFLGGGFCDRLLLLQKRTNTETAGLSAKCQ
jgi:hypothetical protein